MSVFTQRHYKIIADRLNLARSVAKEHPEYSAQDVLAYLTGDLAARFVEDNDNFKTDLFLQAADPDYSP